jgi:hypothetical protein
VVDEEGGSEEVRMAFEVLRASDSRAFAQMSCVL